MYGTRAAFDYITVGGRCAYETNKIFEFPKQSFYTTNSLYTTEHDGIRCDFMDISSYLETLFDVVIDSDNFYMLRLVYYAKNVDNLNLKITWKKEGAVDFCSECYENVVLEISGDKFLYANIDLRQNPEWVGKITNLRLGVYNTEIVPLFIKYFSVYSPTSYKCTKPACSYYSKYNHPCAGGKDLHIISGKYFDGNNISLVLDSSFLFNIYNIDFIVKFESNCYFLDVILNELNTFFKSIPIPCLQTVKADGRIKLICDYVKPIIKHTELSEKLGFFNNDGSESNIYTIENGGESDYVDVAGNLKGIYTVSDLENLDFNELFDVGFSDDGDFYPESSFEFFNQTVIFYTLVISFDGYLNFFEIYCKVLSGGGKILIYRRDGDIYEVVNSYFLSETTSMSKHTIDWVCRVYKGDVIGVYNLKLGISKKTSGPINYYGVVSGYLNSINKTNVEAISFSSVSIYAYFKLSTTNDIPITAFYNEASYVDNLSFLLEYSSRYGEDFNIMFDSMFNCELVGCQINVKDTQQVVTEIPGEIVGLVCLSDNVVFLEADELQLEEPNTAPPIDLSTISNKDVLRYSWNKYILEFYESKDYTYTFIPGSVFFYYEFPTIIDIYKVLIYSTEEEMSDKYLLKVLDNTKSSPSFSNLEDVILLDSQINNWEFIIEDYEKTKGLGVFVYNYGNLPSISFSEIELYTKIGNIPEYIVDIAVTTPDDYIIPFCLDIVGTKNTSYIGSHIKSLIININFITDNRLFNFKNIGIYSSYLPDDYFVSENAAGEGTLTIYNTRSKALNCYLLDYSLKTANKLVYEYNFDNEILHKGLVPVKYTHSKFYFVSGNYYVNNEYNTYALKTMLSSEAFFITKIYKFDSQEYEDWYVPYDYLIPGFDGEFVYIDGGLKLKPAVSEAIRWFNYININEFYNDIDIELKFNYVGNIEDFVFIGITCCDRNYNNYLKFYGAFQFSSEYGLEFKLENESEPTYYKFAAILGRDTRLKIKKRGKDWTFFCFYSDLWHELTTFTLFDTEILVSISTIFNAPHIKDNIIAEFVSCEIKASKVVSGKKVWYTINDGLNYIYSGNVLDNSTILDNFNKNLTFSRDYTIKKFIYSFNNVCARYLKFVNILSKSIKITEIKCYLTDVIVPIEQGYVSYSDDIFFGNLEGETSHLDDNIIINYDLSNSIQAGGDSVLSAVGVDLGSNQGINKIVLYYIEETGVYEPCRLVYSYDNIVYYDVYDNFSLFSKNINTTAHYFFNEFSGYRGKNEILYDFVFDEQYSTDFSEEGVLEYKWDISSPYVVDDGGVWLKHLSGAENLYSKFSIDGDFIIDIYFDSFSNYSGGDARVYLKLIFKNNTYYDDVYVYQDFDSDRANARFDGCDIEENETSGGLRIKRTGSVFYFYYRKHGTTWYEVDSYDYGYDYVYPVDINVYLYGDNSFDLRIEKILMIEGIGIASTDLAFLESPSVSTLFVCGREFSNSDTYAVASSQLMTKLFYPFSFSLLHSVVSSIPFGGSLVEKPYDFCLTYVDKDLSLGWFSEYFTEYKIEDVLSYSSIINTISSVSVGNYNVNENLFTDISEPDIKAIYKSRCGINTIIDETFRTGEGTFDTVFSGVNITEYMCDDFTGNDGDLYNQTLWSGSISNIEIKDNKLHILYCNDYIYINTKYKPVGDFNVQVDFSVGDFQNSNYWSFSLGVYFENGDEFSIESQRVLSYFPYRRYKTKDAYYKSGVTPGKLRITKKGNIFSSYFLQENRWFHLNTWHLTEDTEVAYIRLDHYSWSYNPPFECYFDNFMINDDFDFYADVVIDGDYSHVDGNYIKLSGGNIRTNKAIRSANAITFECSVTIEDYNDNLSSGLIVCNTPFRSFYNDTSGESISILYCDEKFKLYIDGTLRYYLGSTDAGLFCPIYGQPYTIGVKFIPGTGTIIYWQGPTNGYLVFDYIINGDLYAWWGNHYGAGDYGSQITRIHRFRCFEDKVLYKELINDWSQSVGVDDSFILADGRGPDLNRWEVNGNPKIYSNSLKLVSSNEDKIQSRTFFCSPFEIVLDYHDLVFGFIEELALSLNLECYDIYKDNLIGVSNFKVGYNGGVASWVNYYCDEASGNSDVYHISDVSNRKLKIKNDGYNIQYLLSDGGNWITILSIDCNRQHYYKISIEGTDLGVVACLDSIIFDCEDFMTPTSSMSLVPTGWKFSPTHKAYQTTTYIPLNELINRSRHFYIDGVVKIDNSMFLSYIEIDKDLIEFDGAIVVGDNYPSLISAIDVAKNGEIIYVLPGTYDLGGYTINKNLIIMGVGDYRNINIIIGSTVKLDGCDILFKNLTITEQLLPNDISFRTQGDKISYFTMDNCKYVTVGGNHVYVFNRGGTQNFYVYLKRCYFSGLYTYHLASVGSSPDIIIDILNCRISLSRNYLIGNKNGYQIRAEIYANISEYEPRVINTVPVLTLFSPANETNIYLSTPKGMEKEIVCKPNVFNYIAFGNSFGGVVFYGGDNDYYFSEYLIPPVNDSFVLFVQGWIDTVRVFDTYPTYYGSLANINIINNLGINLQLVHNKTIVNYKSYEPINQYDSSLILGYNTPSVIDEFIWFKVETASFDLLAYYDKYLEKSGYSNCNIFGDSIKYKFFIDMESTVGIGSLVQSVAHNFSTIVCYSDNISDPSKINTVCSLFDARWYMLSNNISQDVSSLDPGTFSVFPTVSGCDYSRWNYSGESGYTDIIPHSVLNASSSLNSVYNIKWKRNKTDVNDYMVSNFFDDPLVVDLKLFGGGLCDKIIIKSGYDIGTEYAGYITKCDIVIDSVTRFSIENNINSIITATFNSIPFNTIELIVYEVKQVSGFIFNEDYLTGNVLFINYIKVLSFSSSKNFNTTLCNVYELYNPLKLKAINTSKTGTCLLDYYFNTSYTDECAVLSNLNLDSLPNNKFVSILAKSDNLYDCSFAINEYTVNIQSELITSSIDSWRVYYGDVKLYEEFFYIREDSTSIGAKFFKDTLFEIGTYYEIFGTNTEWSITDELVLTIYSSNNINDFYMCIGDKTNGRYYRWDFNLVSGWNNLRFNFYGEHVTKYVSDIITRELLFNDLEIFNIWFGGEYLHNSGFMVLDSVFVDRSSVKNILSSKKDAFYIPVYFESESGSIHMDYTAYWDSAGKIFENILSDKILLSVFGDKLSFSLVNKSLGEFALGVYSYEYNVKTVKTFGKAGKFTINDKLKLRLDWYCNNGYFSSDLYINGIVIGRIRFDLIEIDKLKITGIMVGGGSVYITSIYNSLSLCGQVNYIKVYSSSVESDLVSDKLLIKIGGEYKTLVENSPLYIGEIQPSQHISLSVKHKGKSKKMNQLDLKVKWIGIY